MLKKKKLSFHFIKFGTQTFEIVAIGFPEPQGNFRNFKITLISIEMNTV